MPLSIEGPCTGRCVQLSSLLLLRSRRIPKADPRSPTGRGDSLPNYCPSEVISSDLRGPRMTCDQRICFEVTQIGRTHNPEVAGSNPARATSEATRQEGCPNGRPSFVSCVPKPRGSLAAGPKKIRRPAPAPYYLLGDVATLRAGAGPETSVGLQRPDAPSRSWKAVRYVAVGGPNQLVSASGSPGSISSPTQATCASGRINTAGGAVTVPSTGSSHGPTYSASII
jgi:hypothetical protein